MFVGDDGDPVDLPDHPEDERELPNLLADRGEGDARRAAHVDEDVHVRHLVEQLRHAIERRPHVRAGEPPFGNDLDRAAEEGRYGERVSVA